MQIIPVIDLKGGQVVHGRAGNREQYRPVQSILADTPTPAAIARGLADRFGRCTIYIADLDAIAGADPDWPAYDEILKHHASCWIDAGITGDAQAQAIWQQLGPRATQIRLIVGLETIASRDELRHIAANCGTDACVFSLDLRHGIPWARAPDWNGCSAQEIAAHVVASGIDHVIILDVARIGMGTGTGTSHLCRELSQRFPQVNWIAGGGIASMHDIRALYDQGCRGVLVASALHDGRITADVFQQIAAWGAGSTQAG